MDEKDFKQHLYTFRWYGNHLLENPNEWQKVGKDLVELTTDLIDGKAQIEEPERPTAHYEIPVMKELDFKYTTRGKYLTKSGKPKGLIVHYTAGRPSAYNTAVYLKNRGLGCMVMDEEGKILTAQGMDEVAWHAGSSKHPFVDEVTGLSRYCMGMEIVNPGMVEKRADGLFYSWFGAPYGVDEVRYATGHDNIKQGHYVPFTDAQEQALINFCKWQLATNDEFEIDWILGHDEIAPGRKSDPGAALSMSMPDFREMLRTAKQG